MKPIKKVNKPTTAEKTDIEKNIDNWEALLDDIADLNRDMLELTQRILSYQRAIAHYRDQAKAAKQRRNV
jgi:hypothetical protein